MPDKKMFTTKRMVRAATIAALYVVLTYAFWFLSFESVQFRISEMLTILPLFFPEAIVGLSVGCFVSNLISPNNLVLDLTLGTTATMVAAILTYIIGRLIKHDARVVLGIVPPIVINAFVVPFTFLILTELKEFYWVSVGFVGLGQAVVLIVLGTPLYFVVKRLSVSSKYFR